MAANQALEAALALAVNPSLILSMRQARLPGDISTLLRFLAGDVAASDLTDHDPAGLPDVIERYVVAVMLYPGAAPLRVLGVTETASRPQIRSHMRWLMVWLHPDRAGRSWRSAYSTRVLEAWRQVSRGPLNVAPPRISPLRKRRPQTKPVKLTWVARPLASPRRGKSALLGSAVLVVLSMAAAAAFDNPVRQWAELALNGVAPAVVRTVAP